MLHPKPSFRGAAALALAGLLCMLLQGTTGLALAAEPAAGSDLFKELQAQNAKLQQAQQETLARLQARDREMEALQKQILEARSSRQALDLERQQALDREAQLRQRLADSEARGDEAVAALKELRAVLASQADAVGAHQEHIALVESEKESLRQDSQQARSAEAAARAESQQIRDQWEATAAGIRRERATVRFNLAVIHDKRGHYRDAEREYLRCLEFDPGDQDARYNLGILYHDKLREPAKAREHYQAFLTSVPEGSDAERVRGWLAALDAKPH